MKNVFFWLFVYPIISASLGVIITLDPFWFVQSPGTRLTWLIMSAAIGVMVWYYRMCSLDL